MNNLLNIKTPAESVHKSVKRITTCPITVSLICAWLIGTFDGSSA